MADLFVSYSRHDAEFVRRLCAALEARQREVWIDRDDIPPASPWRSDIADAIDAASAVVFVVSPDSAVSVECRREIEHAVARGKRLIPLAWRPPGGAELPPRVAELNWLFFDEARLDDSVTQLLAVADTDLDWSRAHARLLQRAQDWQAAERDSAKLLRGRDLAEAERWLGADRPPPSPVDVQRSYVAASRDATRRARRRLWASLAGVAVVGLALMLWVVFERGVADQRERQALSRRLTQQSEQTRDQRPDQLTLAVQLAVEAVRREPSIDALQALGAGLALLPRRLWQDTLPSRSGVALAFTPDGRQVLSADAMWDVDSGKRLLDYRHEGRSRVFAVSADGRWMVRSGGVQPPMLFDRASGERRELQPAERRMPIGAVAFSPDGSLLAAADQGVQLHLWRVADGRRLWTRPPDDPQLSGPVNALAFAPDGSWLAVARRNQVRRLSLPEGRPLEPPLEERGGSVVGLAVAPDGRIATVARGGEVRLHALDGTAVDLPPLPSATQRGPTTLQFADDGRWLGAAGAAGAMVWDVQARKVHLPGLPGPWLTFGADGGLVVVGGGDGSVRLFDLPQGRERLRLAHDDVVEALAISADGDRVATASADGRLRMWSTRPALPALSLPGQQARMVGEHLVALSDEGAVIAGADQSPALKISGRDPRFGADGRLLVVAQQDRLLVHGLPDGRLLASLAHEPAVDWAAIEARVSERRRADLRQALWEVEQARVNGSAAVVAIAPDGSRLLSTRVDELARLWDLRSGRVIATIPYRDRLVAAFSADSRVALVASGTDVQLIDATSGATRQRWSAPDRVVEVALAADGSAALLRTNDQVLLWRAGQAAAETVVPTSTEPTVAADGRTAVVPAAETTHVWLLDGPAPTRTLNCDCRARLVAFSADSDWLALADDRGRLHVRATSAEHAGDDWIVVEGIGEATALAIADGGGVLAAAGSDPVLAETEADAGQPHATGRTKPWLRAWRLPGKVEIALDAELGEVGGMRFDRSGRLLAAGSFVYDLGNGQRVARVPGSIVAFVEKPPWLVSIGNDEVWAWPWRSADLLTLACRTLPGGLSTEAWARYVGAGHAYVDSCAEPKR